MTGPGEMMPPCLMLVDDDADSRTILRTVFELSGYEVFEAVSGDEALRLAQERSFDVILMDMEVPGKNGWDATRALRDNPETVQIPVIAVSAHALPRHKARALEAGCVRYLTKPIEPKLVVEEVASILHPRGLTPST